jgi:hypothetical protein
MRTLLVVICLLGVTVWAGSCLGEAIQSQTEQVELKVNR